MMRAAIGALALLFLAAPLQAHDEGTQFSQWMMSRKQPDTKVSCCGEADQFWVRSYAATNTPGMAFRAVVEDKVGGVFEIDVPAEKVDWESVNPTGRGVIFISSTGLMDAGREPMVLCFIPGIGG